MMDYETMKTQLTGDYRAVFDKAQTYLMTSQFPQQYADDKMMELYDLLLTAQTEQKPAEQIAGRDSAAFVQNFFSDYAVSRAERLHAVADALKRLSIVMLVILFLDFIAEENTETGFFASRTNASMMLFGLLGGLVFLAVNQFVLRPASLKTKKIHNTGWAFIIIGLFIAVIAAEVILMKGVELSVPTAALMIALGAYLLGFYIVRSVWRLKKYGTVRDIHKAEKPDSYYTSLPNRDVERAYMQGMLIRYRRLARKGKITEEAFLDKMMREEKIVRYADFALIGFILVIALPSVIKVAQESSLFNTLFYIAVLGLVEFGIYRFYTAFTHRASAARMHIYTNCTESGMTLPAYLESQVGSR